MKDLSNIVLVSDMDGTLLDSKKEISQKNREAIEKFRSMGGRFTIATGRTIQSFAPYAEDLKIDIPIIMYNGAMIYDYSKEEIMCSVYLPKSAKSIAVEIMNNVDNLGGEILRAEGTYIFQNNEYEQLHTDLCGIVPNFCTLKDIECTEWLKVLFASSPENLEKLVDFVAEKGYNEVSFVKSSDIFYEMLEPSSNKGTALEMYRKLDDMKNCIFVSVGDYNNDIEMIKTADIGAVPSNAQPEVKAVADVVLKNSCDEDAIAELIDFIIEKYGR